MSHPVHGKCHKTREVIKQSQWNKPFKTQADKDLEASTKRLAKQVRENEKNRKKYGGY